ncbi:hypothetical protein DFH11DRAFT_1654187 [Phellopilus nigrolimitatus]|nr:hypothetical protein DFH11DRAFT_1654187 [Phellopilus nigrolimitatus]
MRTRLCRKMMEQISLDIQDDNIRNSEGKPITGGLLLRKYLNRCQEDFEGGCKQKESTHAATAENANEDHLRSKSKRREQAVGRDTAILERVLRIRLSCKSVSGTLISPSMPLRLLHRFMKLFILS